MTTPTTIDRGVSPVARLLKLRDHDTAARVAMRRATSIATEHYAYPYLANHWVNSSPWVKQPLLRFAGLLGTAIRIGNNPAVTLGQFLSRTAIAGEATRDGRDRAIDRVGRRILWAQTGDLSKLDQALRGLIPSSDATGGVSWQSIYDTYLWWDQPDLDRRRTHRRRLIEAFYGTPTTETSDTSTASDVPAAPIEGQNL